MSRSPTGFDVIEILEDRLMPLVSQSLQVDVTRQKYPNTVL